MSEFILHDNKLPRISDNISADRGAGVDIELSQDLEQKVISHRNEYRSWFMNRYRELIINIRNYINLPVSINKYKLEYYLRNNYEVIIGKNSLGIDTILGINRNRYTISNPGTPYAYYPLSYSNIQWLIPDELKPPRQNFKEITEIDNATSGEFVVLRNKPVSYTNDFELIEMYANRVAEIMASRYSIIIQSKVATIFQGEPGDETANQVIQKIYNGAPFIKFTDLIDPNTNILHVENPNANELLKQLKQEYNDTISELNNHLGINTTGIDKQSGVSDEEVKSNNDVVSSNANMYINGVQEPLNLYNKRFQKKYMVYFNQVSTSDLKELGNV